MRNGTVLESPQDGQLINDPAQAQQAQQNGWIKCLTSRSRSGGTRQGMPCAFWINPAGQTAIAEHQGYYTCPSCGASYNIVHEVPSLATSPEQAQQNFEEAFATPRMYTTSAGITPGEMGQIGEDVVEKLGNVPGYGSIVWWHPGGAQAQSSLDGATAGWGIEVKTISKDAKNHGFFPSGDKLNADKKMPAAVSMGKKGILGLLVLLNFRSNVADIFLKEFDAETGKFGEFRTHRPNVEHLIEEVPFTNPFMDPHNPNPVTTSPVDASGHPSEPNTGDLGASGGFPTESPFGASQEDSVPF